KQTVTGRPARLKALQGTLITRRLRNSFLPNVRLAHGRAGWGIADFPPPPRPFDLQSKDFPPRACLECSCKLEIRDSMLRAFDCSTSIRTIRSNAPKARRTTALDFEASAALVTPTTKFPPALPRSPLVGALSSHPKLGCYVSGAPLRFWQAREQRLCG